MPLDELVLETCPKDGYSRDGREGKVENRVGLMQVFVSPDSQYWRPARTSCSGAASDLVDGARH